MESSIHSHAIADRETGVTQGSNTRNRTSHLPRKSATRMFASTFPKTTIRTIEIALKTSVFRSDVQKTGSSNIRWKLRKPTQSKPGCPPVTSLRLKAIARKNGSATSAMM